MSARGIASSAILIVVSAALACVAGEFLLRMLFPIAPRSEKTWLLSSPTFQLDPQGAVRYLPNQQNREIVLAGDRIVYDVHFPTNDLGLIDHQDYTASRPRNPETRRYAFVGDSFTAGIHGGTPWVPTLRERALRNGLDVEVYNLGVEGTGFENFFRLLGSVDAQIDLQGSEIVILAISDDFWRPFWRPLVQGDAIRFCDAPRSDADCLAGPAIGRIIDPATSQADAVAFASELTSSGGDAPPGTLRQRLIANSRLASLLFAQYRRFKLPRSKGFQDSIEWLRRVRTTFPDTKVRMIHLPTMSEVARGDYDLRLESTMQELGIEYFPALPECRWPEAMFFTDDGHPNASGYEAIARCVSGHLGLEGGTGTVPVPRH